jgi:adenosylcobinamide kinase / adenosylcobinamide-phosphate guanylyltransferase
MLTLILGGARSGKSRLAQRLAMSAERVTYIATALASVVDETGNQTDDPEMIARIQHHRAQRPASWRTVEEPLALAEAVERAATEADTVLVDCLTIWLSNLCYDQPGGCEHVQNGARAQIDRIAAAAKTCHVILVSNELGSGIVPEHPVARAFRDTHGILNQWAAEAADEVILTVAGLPLYLKTRKETLR